MRPSQRHRGRSSHRGPRPTAEQPGPAPERGPARSNVPPEPRRPEQPGTGAASLQPVAAIVRRRAQWRTRSGIRRDWELTFEPTVGSAPDPLMGWTQTTDPLAGHRVAFHTADAAIAFARRKGWSVRVVGDTLSEPGAPSAQSVSDQGASAEEPVAVRNPPCMVDETLRQSFPASDAPSWTLGRSR